MTTPTAAGRETHNPLLPVIGVFKLIKAAILFAAAYALRYLRHESQIGQTLVDWASAIHVDPEGRLMRRLIDKTVGASPGHLHLLGVGLFVYACLFSGEGIGLLARKRWGEYLTVVITSLLLPLEIYELFHPGRRIVKLVVLALNLAILAYLIWNLVRTRPSGAPSSDPVGAAA